MSKTITLLLFAMTCFCQFFAVSNVDSEEEDIDEDLVVFEGEDNYDELFLDESEDNIDN